MEIHFKGSMCLICVHLVAMCLTGVQRGRRRKGAGEGKGPGATKGPEKQRGRRNKGAGEGKGPAKQRGQRSKGAGETEGPEKERPEKQRGQRRRGAGETKGPEKQRGRRRRGAGETKGPEKQRGMSNEAYLPPTFAIAWMSIRISGTSRMSMAMGRLQHRVGLAYIAPGPAAAHLGHFNIDDGHATHDSWRLHTTSPSDRR
jgi:hypothetical protein